MKKTFAQIGIIVTSIAIAKILFKMFYYLFRYIILSPFNLINFVLKRSKKVYDF